MSSELYVLFKVGGGEYALPARQVAQMESYTGATAIPAAAAHVAGIVQVRGRIVPVIDLRVKFGFEATPATIDSRLVIVRLGEREVGLLVDQAREVARLADGELESPPPLVNEQSNGIVRALGRVGDRVVMLVDADGLVGEEQIDAG
jgi:purine-binding chemotaxis protein CheW